MRTTEISITCLDGSKKPVSGSSMEELSARFGGELLGPGDTDYDETRKIWNAMIDRRPGLIARCRTAADVAQAVRFARERGLLAAVRGAGHNIAGNAVCEGGLMIDLSPMRSVKVDAARRTARVEGGATLHDFDEAAQAHGLATPIGINSTTGISGLTLGGGFGWLSRKYGLAIDNLVSADVVTADGESVKASAEENADLFWGIRGGGGNFGIVTSFEFRLHPVGPNLLSGLIVHPFDDAARTFRQYRDFVAKSPDELSVWVVMRKAPPLPVIPQEMHGKEILAFAVCYVGDPKEGEKIVAPLRAIGKPVADLVAVNPFVAFQSTFDPMLAAGLRNYWKSHNFLALSDGLIDILVRFAGNLPAPESEIAFAQLGGATSRVAPDATAYVARDAAFVLNVHTRWENPSDDERCIRWARDLFEATRPFASTGAYVNFMPEDETDRVQAAYGPNYSRLVALKKKYDPTNLFRLNQNIRP